MEIKGRRRGSRPIESGPRRVAVLDGVRHGSNVRPSRRKLHGLLFGSNLRLFRYASVRSGGFRAAAPRTRNREIRTTLANGGRTPIRKKPAAATAGLSIFRRQADGGPLMQAGIYSPATSTSAGARRPVRHLFRADGGSFVTTRFAAARLAAGARSGAAARRSAACRRLFFQRNLDWRAFDHRLRTGTVDDRLRSKVLARCWACSGRGWRWRSFWRCPVALALAIVLTRLAFDRLRTFLLGLRSWQPEFSSPSFVSRSSSRSLPSRS